MSISPNYHEGMKYPGQGCSRDGCLLLFLLFVSGSKLGSFFLVLFPCYQHNKACLLSPRRFRVLCITFLVTRRDIVMEVAYSSKVGHSQLGVHRAIYPAFWNGLTNDAIRDLAPSYWVSTYVRYGRYVRSRDANYNSFFIIKKRQKGEDSEK